MTFLNFITCSAERKEIRQLLDKLKAEKCLNYASKKSMCGEIYKFIGCTTVKSRDNTQDIRGKNDRRHQTI